MRERILGFLAQGVSQKDTAEIVNCSASYISQLLADQDFLDELSEAVEKLPKSTEEEHISKKYEVAEHKVLASILGSLEDAKLGEKTRLLEVIAKRQMEVKKLNILPALAASQRNVQIVNLQLPAIFQKTLNPTIEMNSDSEVIAIGGQNLAPLAGEGVKNLFAQLAARKAELQNPTLQQHIQHIQQTLEIPSDF